MLGELKFNDLRFRLGVLLALALAPLLIVSVLASFSEYISARNQDVENLQLRAETAIADVTRQVELGGVLAEVLSLQSDEGQCPPDLTRISREFPKVRNIIVNDADGAFVCSLKETSPILGSPRELQAGLTPMDKTALRTMVIDYAEGGPALVTSTIHQDFVAGIRANTFYIIHDFELLSGVIDFRDSSVDMDVFIVNELGVPLFGNPEYENQLPDLTPLPEDGETIVRNIQINGKNKQVVITDGLRSEFYTVIIRDTPLRAYFKHGGNILSSMMPVFAWLFGFLAIWLATDRLILKHLRQLRGTALMFARGRSEQRVGEMNNPPDEIYELGRTFDLMADKISGREAELKDNLEEKEVLLREIHHRVKNNLQIIISLLNIQERKIKDKVARKTITDIRNRVNAISLVHRSLYEGDQLQTIDVETYLVRLVPDMSRALIKPGQNIRVDLSCDVPPMDVETAIPVAQFIIEAFTNAVQHALPKGGEIKIKLAKREDNIKVCVSDSGPGFNFDEVQMGTGSRLIQGFARQLSGEVERNYKDGFMTTSLIFPKK